MPSGPSVDEKKPLARGRSCALQKLRDIPPDPFGYKFTKKLATIQETESHHRKPVPTIRPRGTLNTPVPLEPPRALSSPSMCTRHPPQQVEKTRTTRPTLQSIKRKDKRLFTIMCSTLSVEPLQRQSQQRQSQHEKENRYLQEYDPMLWEDEEDPALTQIEDHRDSDVQTLSPRNAAVKEGHYQFDPLDDDLFDDQSPSHQRPPNPDSHGKNQEIHHDLWLSPMESENGHTNEKPPSPPPNNNNSLFGESISSLEEETSTDLNYDVRDQDLSLELEQQPSYVSLRRVRTDSPRKPSGQSFVPFELQNLTEKLENTSPRATQPRLSSSQLEVELSAGAGETSERRQTTHCDYGASGCESEDKPDSPTIEKSPEVIRSLDNSIPGLSLTVDKHDSSQQTRPVITCQQMSPSSGHTEPGQDDDRLSPGDDDQLQLDHLPSKHQHPKQHPKEPSLSVVTPSDGWGKSAGQTQFGGHNRVPADHNPEIWIPAEAEDLWDF